MRRQARRDQVVRAKRRVGAPPGTAVARTYQWQRLRKQFRAHCAQYRLPCWRCGEPIDYHAKAYQPLAFEADHKLPVSTHKHLAYVWSNLAAIHSRCNRAARDEGAPGEWVRPTWCALALAHSAPLRLAERHARGSSHA